MALGECGLDRNRGGRNMQVQVRAFTLQVQLALRLRLPLVLHIREAEAEGRQVLMQVGLPGNWPVHRHCWNDEWEVADSWLRLYPGSVLGLTALVRKKGAQGEEARRVASLMPLDRLVLETDAPYLKPSDLKGLMQVRVYHLDMGEASQGILVFG